MKFLYLGEFPPPYGGVTIKNKLLHNEIAKYHCIRQSGFYQKEISKFSRSKILFQELFCSKKGLIIGLSRESLRKVTYLLYILNKNLMNNSIVMVMGGTFPQIVQHDKILCSFLKEYKHIYVETVGMKTKLNLLGLNKVSVYPNCRQRSKTNIAINKDTNQKLRCLYFSFISKNKGADIVIDAAKILDKWQLDYSIDFYGYIEDGYTTEFNDRVAALNSVNYYGVYREELENVYTKLHTYDLLLFPTKCETEGVPGILVEAKIAGLPAVVSDVSYNSNVINDGKDGIVLKRNSSFDLAKSIEQVYKNRNFLVEMKKNALASSQYYLIENHIGGILKKLESEGAI